MGVVCGQGWSWGWNLLNICVFEWEWGLQGVGAGPLCSHLSSRQASSGNPLTTGQPPAPSGEELSPPQLPACTDPLISTFPQISGVSHTWHLEQLRLGGLSRAKSASG